MRNIRQYLQQGPVFMPPSKRKELRTVLALSFGLAIAMFGFVMVAKIFMAGPG